MSKMAKNSKEIQDRIDKFKKKLENKSISQDEREFLEEELIDAEKELADFESKPKEDLETPKESKKSKEAKQPKEDKVVVKKGSPSTKTSFSFDDKTITKEDIEYCEQLLVFWRKRKEKSKQNPTKKTKPAFVKIGEKVTSSVKTAIQSVDFKKAKDVDGAIDKIEVLQEASKKFLNAFKDVLGSEFDSDVVKEEYDSIEKMIDDLVKKYKK